MNGSVKRLFYSYGYSEYKLSGFEEYALYSENKDFLTSKQIIAFSAGGKLLALRPDVTLSIVKNIPEDKTYKLFYEERVYRPDSFGGFSEFSQVGAEVIGEADYSAEAEILILLKKCLAGYGLEYFIEMSHAGAVSYALDKLKLSSSDREYALGCLHSKSVHSFINFAGERIREREYSDFLRLITAPSEPAAALAELKEIFPQGCAELEEVIFIAGADGMRINFSVAGDENYYNGLIFKGYIKGAPKAVAHGGRYDKLLPLFSKRGSAVGFAVYTGEIESAVKESPVTDAAVIYNKNSAKKAFEFCEKLRGEGKNVLMCVTPPPCVGKVYTEKDYD